MSSVLMSEVGERFSVGDDYSVKLPHGDHLVLVAGVVHGRAECGFNSPEVAARCCQVFDVKHQNSEGRKWWTAHPGVEFYFVVPKDRIEILPERGYSYVPIQVSGLRTILNVSGGTNGKMWQDSVPRIAMTHIGWNQRTLKNLVSTALSVDEAKAREISFDTPGLDRVAEYKSLVLAKEAEFQPGQSAFLGNGYSIEGSTGPFPVSCHRKGRVVLIGPNGRGFTCRPREIDWLKTAELNDWGLPDATCWNRLGGFIVKTPDACRP